MKEKLEVNMSNIIFDFFVGLLCILSLYILIWGMVNTISWLHERGLFTTIQDSLVLLFVVLMVFVGFPYFLIVLGSSVRKWIGI